ncbi:MAG: hypothetical protein ABIH41_06400 [Nanoarchaeota archaeon]
MKPAYSYLPGLLLQGRKHPHEEIPTPTHEAQPEEEMGPMRTWLLKEGGRAALDRFDWYVKNIPPAFQPQLRGPWEPLSFKGETIGIFGIESMIGKNASRDACGLFYDDALHSLSVWMGYPSDIFGTRLDNVREYRDQPSARLGLHGLCLSEIVDGIAANSAARFVWQPYVRKDFTDDSGLTHSYEFEGQRIFIPSMRLIEQLRDAYRSERDESHHE